MKDGALFCESVEVWSLHHWARDDSGIHLNSYDVVIFIMAISMHKAI